MSERWLLIRGRSGDAADRVPVLLRAAHHQLAADRKPGAASERGLPHAEVVIG